MSTSAPFLVIKLRPGWVLAGDGRSVVAGVQRIVVDLPSGARLVPALRVPPPPFGEPTEAERELARFVHLRLPHSLSADDALLLAGGWPFVERVERPPPPALDPKLS